MFYIQLQLFTYQYLRQYLVLQALTLNLCVIFGATQSEFVYSRVVLVFHCICIKNTGRTWRP